MSKRLSIRAVNTKGIHIAAYALTLVLSVLLFLSLLPSHRAMADETAGMRIEQAHTDLPNVSAYFYVNGIETEPTASDLHATLGTDELSVDSFAGFADSGIGIEYYIISDISGSIEDDQINAEKKALNNLIKFMGDSDRMILITVGTKIDTVLQGGETKAAMKRAINDLDNNAKYTHMYDGISTAFDMADAASDDLSMRRVSYVFTDGIDDTKGGAHTADEVADRAENASLPLYALSFDGGNKDARDTLGNLSRASGGKFTNITSSNTAKKLKTLDTAIRSCYVAALNANSNNVTADTQLLRLELRVGSDSVSGSKQINVRSYQEDTTSPEVSAVDQLEGQDGIRVTFSEAVTGADDKDAYVIKDDDGTVVAIKKVAYSNDGTGAHTEVIFNSEPYSGDYSLTINGVKDISAEQNQLTGDKDFSYKGKSEIQRTIDRIMNLLQQWWWVILIIAIAAIVLIMLRYFKRRRGLVKVEGKVGFGDMVEYRQHFSTPSTGGASLIITDSRGASQKSDIDINKSFFIGRSRINNMSFDDDKMSRQHFVIEADNGEYYITDLETTNGTYLNGVQIKARRKIADKDVITAGREKFVFRARRGDPA